MKKILGIAVLLIAMLHGLTASLYSSNALNIHTAFSKSTADGREGSFAVASSEVFCHAIQTESSVSGFNNVPSSPLKNPFNSFSAFLKSTEQLLHHAFSQYRSYSLGIIIRFNQADLIFPFHYFW